MKIQQWKASKILQIRIQIGRNHLPWCVRFRLGQIEREDIRHFDYR